MSFYQVCDQIAFLDVRDLPLLPMLRIVHQYPTLMQNRMQCDKGAIKHIFSGSHVMAPGLLSEGGHCVEGLPTNAPVSVFAEGKEHAMAVGVLQMSSAQIMKEKKGEAITICNFMNDGIWHTKAIEQKEK